MLKTVYNKIEEKYSKQPGSLRLYNLKRIYMRAIQANIQSMIQPDISQAYNAISMVAALQSELAMLQAKVETYYYDEIVLRGDKNLMRDYCGHFGIQPAQPNI
jgi:hypothetical protein